MDHEAEEPIEVEEDVDQQPSLELINYIRSSATRTFFSQEQNQPSLFSMTELTDLVLIPFNDKVWFLELLTSIAMLQQGVLKTRRKYIEGGGERRPFS